MRFGRRRDLGSVLGVPRVCGVNGLTSQSPFPARDCPASVLRRLRSCQQRTWTMGRGKSVFSDDLAPEVSEERTPSY